MSNVRPYCYCFFSILLTYFVLSKRSNWFFFCFSFFSFVKVFRFQRFQLFSLSFCFQGIIFKSFHLSGGNTSCFLYVYRSFHIIGKTPFVFLTRSLHHSVKVYLYCSVYFYSSYCSSVSKAKFCLANYRTTSIYVVFLLGNDEGI